MIPKVAGICLIVFALSFTNGCSKGGNLEVDVGRQTPERFHERQDVEMCDETMMLDFEYIMESAYCKEALFEARYLRDDVSFLFLECVDSQAGLEYYARQGRFSVPQSINFENDAVLISYGRMVEEFAFVRDGLSRQLYGSIWMISVTFGEEYFGEAVFFYRMPLDSSIGYVPAQFGIITYVMVGTEKIRVYVSDINIPKLAEGEG